MVKSNAETVLLRVRGLLFNSKDTEVDSDFFYNSKDAKAGSDVYFNPSKQKQTVTFFISRKQSQAVTFISFQENRDRQ